MPIYVADTNFFVQAHRMHYPLDIVPGFWLKIIELDRRGILVSIDKVKAEMVDYKDVLSKWIKTELSADFFKDTSTVVPQYATLTGWAATHPQYTTAAKAEFCDDKVADAWICAYALANQPDAILLTHEKSEKEIKKKVKIPEVCAQFNMTCVNTIQMFRQLNETFL
jgi:Domain of unknown function (DUF4411)